MLERLLSAQNRLYGSVAIAVVLTYLLAITVVWNGRASLLLPGMVLLSPVAMLLLRIYPENWFARSFFNPHVMSLSFIMGDTVLLPISLTMAGTGWAELPETWWHETWWFATGCWGVGLLAGCAATPAPPAPPARRRSPRTSRPRSTPCGAVFETERHCSRSPWSPLGATRLPAG